MRHSFMRVSYPTNPLDDQMGTEPTLASRSPTLEPTDIRNRDQNGLSRKHFIVAIDFGTTFSAVAFTVLKPGERRDLIQFDDIEYLSNYPGAPPGVRGQEAEVPTESCYPKVKIQRDDLSFFKVNSRRAREADDDEDGTDGGEDHAEDMDIDIDERPSQKSVIHPEYSWGYRVHQVFKFPNPDRCAFQKIVRSKLLLYKSEHTKVLRKQLQDTIKELKKLGTIRNGMNLIVDFLTQLLVHTKQHLFQTQNLLETDSVEFVLSVPVIWHRLACRQMQNALREASYRSDFGRIISDSVENLYIVTEPEAAAARFLASTRKIAPGETFMILDAGGGTVDAITYKLRGTAPLTMEKEAVKPDGALCGSSYLNEEFEKLVHKRLDEETYLFNFEVQIETLISEFDSVKRTIDIHNGNKLFHEYKFVVLGLRENKEKKLVSHGMRLDLDDFKSIFSPCLDGVANLMLNQIEAAQREKIFVKKVLLVGGFGASPSLRHHLKKVLHAQSKTIGTVELLCPDSPETMVASGAVLRALNKDEGPARIIQSSYGFLRTEPWEPDVIEAHKASRPRKQDPTDGDMYVKNTIYWVIKKGDEILPLQEHSLSIIHTIEDIGPATRLICEEVLYVSDKHHESHYRKGHKKNKGAKEAGKICVDMTFLRTEGHIKPIVPEDKHMRRHYRIEYTLVMIVDGFNIRYEARWHDGNHSRVLKRNQINIAAAFVSLETEDDLDENDEDLDFAD